MFSQAFKVHTSNLYGGMSLEKDPEILNYVKKGLNYTKEKVWPFLRKFKGYGRFKGPDEIYVTDALPHNSPAATITTRGWFGRLKKILVVSKDIMKYPLGFVYKIILPHESGHISENISGDLVSEAINDKNLVDIYNRTGDFRTANDIKTHSGYLHKLYGLYRSLFPFRF